MYKLLLNFFKVKYWYTDSTTCYKIQYKHNKNPIYYNLSWFTCLFDCVKSFYKIGFHMFDIWFFFPFLLYMLGLTMNKINCVYRICFVCFLHWICIVKEHQDLIIIKTFCIIDRHLIFIRHYNSISCVSVVYVYVSSF